jgi:hypothetical protein
MLSIANWLWGLTSHVIIRVISSYVIIMLLGIITKEMDSTNLNRIINRGQGRLLVTFWVVVAAITLYCTVFKQNMFNRKSVSGTNARGGSGAPHWPNPVYLGFPRIGNLPNTAGPVISKYCYVTRDIPARHTTLLSNRPRLLMRTILK